MEIKICHLYPDLLNLHGDKGDLLCLRRRLEWRGIEVSVESVHSSSVLKLSGYDMVYIGGGQDYEPAFLSSVLKNGSGEEIRAATADGLPVLAICGGFQLLGRYFEDTAGVRHELAGAADFHTVDGSARMVGNYKFRLSDELGGGIAVGFENHSGKTFLGEGLNPLGTVISGHGNNGEDGTEGLHYINIFGSYSHGPLLPKNPFLCDSVLLAAVSRKYGLEGLKPLDDSIELIAHDEMCERA